MPEKQPPSSTTPDNSFESQYKRVFEAAECRTQAQLGALLKIKQSSVSDAKRRKNIPSDWCVKLFEMRRINPEWIRMGTEPKYLKSADTEGAMPYVVKVVEVRPPAECSAQDLFNELVRRAFEPLDLESVRKEVGASWLHSANES